MWDGGDHNYPRAIVHVDGDAFFVACEVARDPSLRGKCVITGAERGIASALSYEAKARGARRGMSISEIKRLCPDLIIIPSDYETYSLYSQRMYNILKRFTPDVEEYSIDECFADLTGLRQSLRMPYEKMAAKIKQTLDGELGITFSVGLSVNKVLAKVASKWQKPSGLTFIPITKIGNYLGDLPVGKIWGLGPSTSAHLNRCGIRTAQEFAAKSPEWVAGEFTKPTVEIWRELNGLSVLPLTNGPKESYASVSKTKTFTPSSNQRNFIYSQLSQNIEAACAKIRRHNLFTQKFHFFLKTQNFEYHGLELALAEPVCIPAEILKIINPRFDEVYKKGIFYRATGITLSELIESRATTVSLFGPSGAARVTETYQAVDALARKFGKHSVFLGSSLASMREFHSTKKLSIPFLGTVR